MSEPAALRHVYRDLEGMEPSNLNFLVHWDSLRKGHAIPTFHDWVDALTPELAEGNFRAEVLTTDAMVLFTGNRNIERRGSNNTGGSLFSPGMPRDQPMANLRQVLTRPCGMWNRSVFPSSVGDTIHTETVLLPLAVHPGRLPQIIGHVADVGGRQHNALIAGQRLQLSRQWIDLGWGTPSSPPQQC